MKGWRIVAPLAVAGLHADDCLSSCATAPTASDTVDGYVALVPDTLRAGETASFSFTLFNGQNPANSAVTVSVMGKDKAVLASAQGDIDGKGTLALAVPRVAPGEYQVKVAGNGFAETTAVQIQPGTLLFLESDKPIYKPGQTDARAPGGPRFRAEAGGDRGDHRDPGRQGHQGLQEDGDHRRVRHGHHRSAALHRAQPGGVEAEPPPPARRRRQRGVHPAGRAGGGVRPAQVRGEGRSGQGLVPGQRAHHRARVARSTASAAW